jgi:hypothetical protein
MSTVVVTRRGNVLVPVVVSRTVALNGGAKTPVGIVRAGLQGPPGPAGNDTTLTVTATTDLTWPRIVAVDNGAAHYADPTSDSDMVSQLAITTQAAVANAPIVVTTGGTMTESAWNWSPGRIYLALTGGQLTQAPGTTGAILEVGRAITPTTIEFGIQPAILR